MKSIITIDPTHKRQTSNKTNKRTKKANSKEIIYASA